MRPNSISLSWKFSLAIILIVAVFGYFNIYMVNREVKTMLDAEFDERGRSLSRNIAGQTAGFFSEGDENALTDLVDKIVQLDTTVAYLAINDMENRMLALYHRPVISSEEVKKFIFSAGESHELKPLTFTISKGQKVRHFMSQINDGAILSVHLGLIEQDLIGTLLDIRDRFMVMILVFLAIGILGAFVFSRIITQPLKKIRTKACNLSLGSLGDRDLEEKISRVPFWSFGNLFKMRDEIDDLVDQFDDMILRLHVARKELEEMQNSLIHTEKMSAIGNLVAGICHNINNPIAGLKNCINRISQDPDNIEQNRKYLPIMAEAIDSAEGVLKELLALSREEEVAYGYFDIRQSVDHVIAVLTMTLEGFRIAFTKKYTKHIPSVYGNENQIEQVILNIVKNGIDAIRDRQEHGQKQMGEIIFFLEVENTRLKLTISDNGTGIEEDKLLRIFNPFFTTKMKDKGTGLGLSVSYNIIKAHKGEIYASRNAGQGLKVTILLPLNTSTRQN